MFQARVARPFDECWLKNPETDCHEWQRSLDSDGYGERIRVDGVRIRPHRYAYLRAHGAIPEGLMVLHRCDNRRCVNPNHLFVGTDTDNKVDMHQKARHAHGIRQGNAKINETDVERIRDLHRCGVKQQDIAAHVGISQPAVSQVVLRKTWRHV